MSFNSRAPRGARQQRSSRRQTCLRFNSRAPRGARPYRGAGYRRRPCFNSRAPRGARPGAPLLSERIKLFQFTRPAWGATRIKDGLHVPGKFQFTRPAWGATVPHRQYCARQSSFNSRAPRGARRFRFVGMHSDYCFNSRAPRGARLHSHGRARLAFDQFQFTRPAWGATSYAAVAVAVASFQFTRPAWGATRSQV